MDEILLRQLVRQIKVLNVWVTFFGVLFLATLIIAGVLLFKLVSFVHCSEQKISDIQTKTSQTLDVQKRICDSGAGNVLKNYTSTCK